MRSAPEVAVDDRLAADVGERAQSGKQARVAFPVAAGCWVIVAEVVVVLPSLGVVILAREPEVVALTTSTKWLQDFGKLSIGSN